LDGFRDLRHAFGTAIASAGAPMRTLQEWMGHRDIETTQRYADYAPSPQEAALVAAAFSPMSAHEGQLVMSGHEVPRTKAS
jgi:integrase